MDQNQGQQAVDINALFQQCAAERGINIQLAQKNEIIMKLIQQNQQLSQQLSQYRELQSAISGDVFVAGEDGEITPEDDDVETA
jgi:hypothetical protein